MSELGCLSIDCVAPVQATLGEGPVWDVRDSKLYFVDIKGRKLCRYDPREQSTESFDLPEMVSAIAPAARGGFIAAIRHGFARLCVRAGRIAIEPVGARWTGETAALTRRARQVLDTSAPLAEAGE